MNGFFSVLAVESRRRDDCELSLCWSERHWSNQFDRIAQPDGLGIWEERHARVTFCLEYDRSSERPSSVARRRDEHEDDTIHEHEFVNTVSPSWPSAVG